MRAAETRSDDDGVVIVGAGIGGLTLALALHRAGIACRVYDAAAELQPLGVGINVLPHATAALATLGVLAELERVAVVTREGAFFNRFGQLVYSEPLGRWAGHATPQLSIHRGDLQGVLLAAVRERIGADRVLVGHACAGVDDGGDRVRVRFRDPGGAQLADAAGAAAVGCDGIHSAVRKQLYPDEGPPRWSGVNMWRGVVPHAPVLGGATMVRAGWLAVGKMVIYPVRNDIDADRRQLVNWVAELECKEPVRQDWNARGSLDEVFPTFADWHFDWLDVPALIRSTENILEFPMIDQEPLPWWSRGRVTLLGDAAHPMYPRGSNGAGQAILDARVLTESLTGYRDPVDALSAYEAVRLDATANVVRMNRRNPPDAILREVFVRTGDKPFRNVEDVITHEELRAITEGYKQATAGSAR